uniref:TIL domain-containing protein n=1 Tax=Acrobeloides nanus TaxID=290746 RepID=A0A914ECW4_9BILA
MGTRSSSVSTHVGKKARCASNEVFTDCVCEGTCENQNLVCNECFSGCHCVQGYIRHSNGACMLSDRCNIRPIVIRKLPTESTCGDSTCPSGSRCTTSCTRSSGSCEQRCIKINTSRERL